MDNDSLPPIEEDLVGIGCIFSLVFILLGFVFILLGRTGAINMVVAGVVLGAVFLIVRLLLWWRQYG